MIGEEWTQQIIPRFYSSKQLTYWDDKLVAIAGLAKVMWQQHPKMRYVAGHWQEALPSSLLWYCETPGRRITPYVAPSWSWASIQGRIHMKNERAKMQDYAIRCEVTDCWVETSGDDQFGRVLDAGLQIEALALRGTVAGGKSANRISGNLELNGIDTIETRVNMDDDHDGNLQVFALLIKENHIKHPNADAPWHWDVLLVVPKDGDPKQFMRVGVGAINLPQEIPLGDKRLIKSRWVLV